MRAWTLARAHARSGEPAAISAYLGKSDVFDKAIAKFAAAYADQSERDHEILRKAVQSGRVDVSSSQNERPAEATEVPGDDFAKAFLAIWLGTEPPNPEIKTGLLGGACD